MKNKSLLKLLVMERPSVLHRQRHHQNSEEAAGLKGRGKRSGSVTWSRRGRFGGMKTEKVGGLREACSDLGLSRDKRFFGLPAEIPSHKSTKATRSVPLSDNTDLTPSRSEAQPIQFSRSLEPFRL